MRDVFSAFVFTNEMLNSMFKAVGCVNCVRKLAVNKEKRDSLQKTVLISGTRFLYSFKELATDVSLRVFIL